LNDAEPLVQYAVWAGRHALTLFFALLALLLVSTVVAGRALKRFAGTRAPLGLRVAGGAATLVLGAAVFIELAARLGTGGLLDLTDQALIDTLRMSVRRPALHVFGALTHLGDPSTLIGLGVIVAVVLVAAGRRGLAAGWVVAMLGNGMLNPTLKQVFGRHRPLSPDGGLLETGFSFPSGHSSGAIVAYGMLGYLALRLLSPRWHLPAMLAVVALVFTVGASRVFLRVHFASDVVAGFASGAAWLALCVTSMECARRLRSR